MKSGSLGLPWHYLEKTVEDKDAVCEAADTLLPLVCLSVVRIHWLEQR